MNKSKADQDIKQIPIILTAFGTTAKAFATYEKMDKIFKRTFLSNSIHWTYSSKMVRHALKKNKNLDLKDPLEMVKALEDQGYKQIVIQSLHIICGHEFDRLVMLKKRVNLHTSIGLPLLSSNNDYKRMATALKFMIPEDQDQAVVLVGHGTDHPSSSVYPALETVLRQKYGKRIFVGVLEYSPGMDDTLERIKSAGFKKAHLIPLLLVAGMHFNKDLTQKEDSWQKTFERNNIEVSVVDHGIGYIDAVTQIFCDHIDDALSIVHPNH